MCDGGEGRGRGGRIRETVFVERTGNVVGFPNESARSAADGAHAYANPRGTHFSECISGHHAGAKRSFPTHVPEAHALHYAQLAA